jgi:adenylosuccinate synthase
MTAFIVVDLGFGDAGKGGIVDYLCRRERARLVVRTNGGAQAGHNVVTADGRHHTFSQLGAGTFVPNVRTHLAGTMVIHPSALLVEARALERVGINDALERLSISGDALVTTPFHQAAGRLRELARSEPHGSCGVGVGETVRDALTHPSEALRARHLLGRDLRERVVATRGRLVAEMAGAMQPPPGDKRARAAAEERHVLGDPGVVDRWIAMLDLLTRRSKPIVVDDPEPRGTVVLEGAQGVLLDERWGFHPHTTWSDCTTAPAESWLEASGLAGPVHRVGVVRSYMTRHGPGPLPSASDALDALDEPHNTDVGWQGRFRRGWPDPVLWRYALVATGGVDMLAVTHVDQLPRIDAWHGVSGYRSDHPLVSSGTLAAGAPRDLDEQAALTQAMQRARPELQALPSAAADYLAWIGAELDAPVSIVSRGPTAQDKATLV